MKAIVALAILLIACGSDARVPAETTTPAIERTRQAVAQLGQRLRLDFSLPFPADYDIDVHLRQPIALLQTDAGRLYCTHPQVNPYDGTGRVEWMLGAADAKKFPEDNVDCFLDFDDRGEPAQMGIPSRGNWFAGGEGDTHQLWREPGEPGIDFIRRAMGTYWARANACADPVRARAFLAGMEKVVIALCESRKQAETR